MYPSTVDSQRESVARVRRPIFAWPTKSLQHKTQMQTVAAVHEYDEATQTLTWDDGQGQHASPGLRRLLDKHATVLRHIRIRCLLCAVPVLNHHLTERTGAPR